MVIRRDMDKLLTWIYPLLYIKYVLMVNNGRPILYVKLHKSLYGYIKLDPLFYQKLSGEPNRMGFNLNPYNPCIIIKKVNGWKFTIVFKIYDLNMSII